jgi:imidazole glycerol-phosphate synthase subunit HisF
MLRKRIIPALLLRDESLVKTVRFGKFTYVGDPCNTVRIFNELEVDELLFLDITASRERRSPNLAVLKDIASECFMPLGYGGGIQSIESAKAVFDIGFEKIVINSAAIMDSSVVTQIAKIYGSQALINSIDVKRDIWGRYRVRGEGGRFRTSLDPIVWAKEMESCGAGELLLTSMDREGTWSGLDLELVRGVTDAVNIPVIAHGGAGSMKDIGDVVKRGGASAVALGSMVVFQKKGMGVLVNFPDENQLIPVTE